MDSTRHLPDNCGQIVAFEGDVDTIAIQLQLIPPSSKILIIPSLESSLPPTRQRGPFDPNSYIHHVHAALTARIERAHSFLRLSTPTQPRLVFLNGGTVCARAACVRAICDHSTDGNVREAERLFNEAVKDGVDGLLRSQPVPREGSRVVSSSTAFNEEETATSIPAGQNRDHSPARTATPEPEIRGLPGQEFGYISRVPTASSQTADLIVEESPEQSWEALMPQEGVTSRAEKRTTFGGQIPSPIARKLQDADQAEQSGDDSDLEDFTSPLGSAFADPKIFTEDVVLGEAYVVDVPSKYLRASNKRAKSAEMIDVRTTKTPEGTFGPGSPEQDASGSPIVMRPFTADGRLQRKSSLPIFQLPKTVYGGSPVASKKTLLPSASIESSVTESRPFGRRGTFSEDSAIDVTAVSSRKSQEILSYEPVLPLLEDLVIHFKDGSSDEILEFVITSYKDGSYPIPPPPPPKPKTSLVPSPTNSLVFIPSHELSVPRLSRDIAAETDDERSHRRQKSDSYRPDGDSSPLESKQLEPPRSASEMRRFGGLATPNMTPPPTANGISQKFCDFSYTNTSNAVHIQDSLRAILDSYFPTGETGYSQGYNSITAGTDRLWKPVFGNIDDNTGFQRTTVDQIIAFGHEDGVDMDFFAHISGQIEALGMKKSGINRAGKLDLRYFVANVLQTAEEQSKRTSARPWSNPKALATMLVPHLEAYLASNPMIGLLILHYPITHLSTVLALRKLIGADLFKVAGILDGLASEPSFEDQPTTLLSTDPASRAAQIIFQRSRTDSIHNHYTQSSFSTRSTSQPNSLPAHLRNRLSVISLSKADYLLPSTASPIEIKSLLSSISQALIERSSFYTPEPEPSPIFAKYPVPPIPDSPTESDRVSYAHSRKKASRSRPNYASSIASTRTTGSEKARREEAREKQLEKDWENFYLGEDSEDEYDRMVMGRSGTTAMPEMRKRNKLDEMKKVRSKKAFKWLGLA
ncbi:hypothetical protein B7463_g2754, partial [Scytalidium lignicola]